MYNASNVETPSSTSRAASLDSTPGGNVQQNSELYQESIQAMNAQRAERASELGVTSVPTPEAILKPIEDPVEIDEVEIAEDEPEKKVAVTPTVVKRRVISAPKAAPAPQVQERKRVPIEKEKPVEIQTANPNQEPENKYISLMSSQMGQLASSFAAKPMSVYSTQVENEDESNAVSGDQSEAKDTAAEEQADLIFRPGDVIYAETLTSVNSDMESPVLVEVVSGEYKGARLVGSYVTDDASDRMVVTFTNMTLPDGNVLSVNAYAVDGTTAETAVASDVDRRYVARYAPIIAASFISGYASSAASTASTVVGTGDDATVSTTEASSEQSLYAGISSAASAVSTDIMANVPSGPKIILRDGFPIGIIFVDPVEAPAE
jgi:intracellular multiplication protein IcmE